VNRKQEGIDMNYQKIEKSIVSYEGSDLWLSKNQNGDRFLCSPGNPLGLTDQIEPGIFALSAHNAALMRKYFPWLNPQPLGLQTSAGTGDRLGLATTGHILAFEGSGIAPIFAQQSVRENVRTHRTPQQVMDDAMWGVFEMGWRLPWGADGDHLKNSEDIKSFVDAGYTFFTIDPGAFVCKADSEISNVQLIEALDDFNFEAFQISLDSLLKSYNTQKLPVENINCSDHDVLIALIKYGKAILHVKEMYLDLSQRMGLKPFDFEVSVDETDWPTSVFEHYFIANEMKRLGIQWTSLAPRFVGRFEKGVDYIGDLSQFETEYKIHAAIQKYFGNYKISLHSGSDKFSIYRICATNSDYKIHLKTAGTSYLEALRVLALIEPKLFREIYAFSRKQYDTDKVSYHVSAEFSKMPIPDELSDDQLPVLLDNFQARQALHVCFGSVLDQFGKELLVMLKQNRDIYDKTIKNHFIRHLADFIQ